MDAPLDKVDTSICDLLRSDGRRTNTDLARELNVSESLVRRKLKRLIDFGFLRIVAAANPRKLGFELDVWGALNVAPGKSASVIEGLHSLESVRYVAVVSGSYDIFFEALFRVQNELYEFLTQTLGKIDGITSVQTWHILRVEKRNFDWMFSFDQPRGQQ
jgi:Lrp/AsnC family transcriptional regulator for asnA, asnC and gidA